ncbi:hypothetical protein [Nannocystis sp. SCPEA4]|uniref:hypothetical protein n=1 Tax=Nannocystis sp. SCPEA4 TaxID=2996787 RepID=UPI00226E491F|nr:hypothetical protein [Nannocystis sp. SCPEA4]MCY1054238.1 hypothetical protein [Nannocystis sp. SCPEA4]
MTAATLLHGPITAADLVRRWWLRRLGRVVRPLIRRRELRVAVLGSAMVCTALAATLIAPLWLLILGPLVWGVPHLVADLRYMLVRPGYHRRLGLAVLAGPPLAWVALGGHLLWGFLAAALALAVARASPGRRALGVVMMAALAGGFAALGRTGDVLFAHLHNAIAVLLWWAWRPRSSRLHWLPLALMVAASGFLVSDAALWAVRASGGLQWFGGEMGPEYQVWRLSPGVGPEWALRLVLLFCFAQTIHYGVWLGLLPDEDRGRATPPTYRARWAGLVADMGRPLLAAAIAVAVLLALWAARDLMAACHGYFRMARFHGHLELIAAGLLLVEGGARDRSEETGVKGHVG